MILSLNAPKGPKMEMKPIHIITASVGLSALVAAVIALCLRSGPGADFEARLDKLAVETRKLRTELRELDSRVNELRAASLPAGRAKLPAPGVLFHDTFEESIEGWFAPRFGRMEPGEISHTTEEGAAKRGKGALAFKYELGRRNLPLLVRWGAEMRGLNRLTLWARTMSTPAELAIGVQERDESRYNTVVRLEPGEGWRRLECDVEKFEPDGYSMDENGRLDPEQIDSVYLLDTAGFRGQTGRNTLLIDEVRGEYSPQGEAKDESF